MADDTHSRFATVSHFQDSCSWQWPYDKTDDTQSFVGHGNYDDPRLKMSHWCCALVWHFQTRVVIFPCPTHYRTSSVKYHASSLARTSSSSSSWSRVQLQGHLDRLSSRLWPTDTQTHADHATSVTIGRISALHVHAMRPKNSPRVLDMISYMCCNWADRLNGLHEPACTTTPTQ